MKITNAIIGVLSVLVVLLSLDVYIDKKVINEYEELLVKAGVVTENGTRTYILNGANPNEYNKLVETIRNQERIILKQDAVILKAKQIFGFDYSVKDTADMVITGFWRKDGKPIERQDR